MDLLINKGYKTKEAAQEVAKENNISKNYLYNLYLRRKKKWFTEILKGRNYRY